MVIQAFTFARAPHIYFGAGSFSKIDKLLNAQVKTVLVITGSRSFRATAKWNEFRETLSKRAITFHDIMVSGEPSPGLVDSTVAKFRDKTVDMVLSIGGGSAIDAGKAISAMLVQPGSVVDYLEGVGSGVRHSGNKVPFIAVPTTAGTGSEATKNAVLSRVGANGFKKSLRHDNFVPDAAVIDPELMLSCPPPVTAACGMDAFTQLLESYVSTKANPMTDALAWSGLGFIRDSLVEAYRNGSHNIESRTGMAYAAHMSGLTLANAGLGIVHGIASAVGGYFDISHGVICGTLIGPATRLTVKKLETLGAAGEPFLKKYAAVGSLLSGSDNDDIYRSCDLLVQKIGEWAEMLHIPPLKEFTIPVSDREKIIDGSDNKNNPVALDRDDIHELLES
ncbi:iron-containing alcohol dehydrogenase [bacterium]|nr:iron-containing alcohol dehydrogenase [bacterium]